MPEPIKSNPRLKASNTAKNGQRIAERMPTNVSKANPPEPILSVLNSLSVLEKQFNPNPDRKRAQEITGAHTIPAPRSYADLGEGIGDPYEVSARQRGKAGQETFKDVMRTPKVSVKKLPEHIQNSLINKNGTGPDVFSEKHTIKQPKEITLQTEESQYVPDRKVSKIPEERHKLRLNPHTLTGGTASTVKYPKISREAIMQNSEDIKKKQIWESKPLQEKTAKSGETYFEPRLDSDFEVKKAVINPFAVATAKAKEMGYDDFSEGSEGAEKRKEIAEAIKEKENIPLSKATLLCKLDKQIFTLENMGIPDDYVLKAYGSFDAIPENLIKQENRPPIGWFEKTLGTMQKSDYSGNQYRYLVELWKSSDGADEILQKTIVKPLDGDEFFEREKLVEDAESGGEAEEVIGDGTKAKSSDLSPVKTTSTN